MKRRISGLLAVAAVAIAGLLGSAQALHAQGTWSTGAPPPIAATQTVSGTVGGKLYVVAGTSTANQVYDPATSTWGTAAPIPIPLGLPGAGVINGKLYIVGGFQFNDPRIGTTNILEVYDPATNRWDVGSPMPTPRSVFGTGVIGGLLYAVGGQGPCPPCTPLNALEAYDPVTDTWTTLAPMPTARRILAAGVVNGVLYAVGGSSSAAFETAVFLNTVEAYDPVTNMWFSQSPMPTARVAHGVGVIDNILYAISGDNATGPVNIVEAYDFTTNSWTTNTPIPTARDYSWPQMIGGALYVAGSGPNNTPITTLEVFTPAVTFAGTPGFSNCHGESVSALAQQYGSMKSAATALKYPSVKALQNAIRAFCGN